MLPLYVTLLLTSFRTSCCMDVLTDLVSSIAAHEDTVRPERLEVCVVQVRAYSDPSPVDETVQRLVKVLESTYPVTVTRHGELVTMYRRRDATLVLMDATGVGQTFPAVLVSERLDVHECYTKSAKFIVLVDAVTNVTGLTDLFGRLGIVNYLVVPLHVPGNVSARNEPGPPVGSLYTKNHFSRREHLFDIAEHRASTVSRYYPDKLGDVHGYRFYVMGYYEFPYLIDLQRHNLTGGLLVEALLHLIVGKLNGTFTVKPYTPVPIGGGVVDMTFELTDMRMHFMHDFTLMERGGSCLLCPFRTERDFMTHLLKPFSVGIWVVLGTVLIGCRLLSWLLPTQFQGDLVEMVFFGAGVPHLQPFPTRIVAFAVALLVFFLSEAYNAKIISLMSLAKYYGRPETMQELNQSALLISNPGVSMHSLAAQLPGKVLSVSRANRLYYERGDQMYNDYCTVSQCHMALLASSDVEGERGYMQYIMREQVLKKLLTLQLATHSPFHQRFVEFLLRYFESGIWLYRVEGLRNDLADMIEVMVAQFARVVFHFDDLFCVWVLIMVGWLLSLVCFIGELLAAGLKKIRPVGWRNIMRRVK